MRALASVFLAGAGVMAAEILASRALAPRFGASLTTWSLLIAVTLLLGSLGAWLGGVGAARGRHASLVLAFLVAGAGLGLAATGGAVALADRLGSLLLGAGLASLLLLVPVVVPLAAVLPLAVGEAPASVGARTVGRLVAASTLGSLAGTLGAALLLIPALGIRMSFLGLGLGSAVAALGLARRRASRVGAIALGAALVLLASESGPRDTDLVRETAFGRVEIRRTALGSELRVDGILQGARSPLAVGQGSLLRSRQYVELLPFIHPRGRTALCVGLGAGVVPRCLAAYGVDVESVDVNPALVALARDVLAFDGPVHLGDGRRVVRRLPDRYDFLVLDAFQGEVLPAHLVTREAFREAQARLNTGGILCLHVIGSPDHAVTAALAATLATVFDHRLAVRGGVADELQDLYLFASDAPLRIPPSPELAAAGWIGNEPFEPPAEGIVLTDDRNPLDTLNEPLARALRRASS